MMDLLGLIICVIFYTFGALVISASITAGLFLIHIAVVPMLFKYSKLFQRTIVFCNFVQWPLNIDFDEPSKRGINGARNMYLEYRSKVDKCKIKIGVWHIVPSSTYETLKGNFRPEMDKDELNKKLDEELSRSGKPIILYCHGNSNSRGATHRIELYKFFQNMEYHTIAFDYRGYGDSTDVVPSEDGAVEDTLIVYDWLQTTLEEGSKGEKPPIFIWGHSLGTGISAHLLGNLDELTGKILQRSKPLPQPKGLILEAPFNNLADEVANHPLSKLVTWLPYHDCMFVAPFRSSPQYVFRSDVHLARTRDLPIIILHAKDDAVVPFILGVRLYRAILASRSKADALVKLQSFETKEDLGHKWICHAKGLDKIVAEFVNIHR